MKMAEKFGSKLDYLQDFFFSNIAIFAYSGEFSIDIKTE